MYPRKIAKKNDGKYKNVVQKKLNELKKLSFISSLLIQSKNKLKPDIAGKNKFNIVYTNPNNIIVKKRLISILIKNNQKYYK